MPLGSSRALDSDTASVTSANSAGSTSVISQASKSVHISQSSRSSSALWPSVSGYTKKELSVIGEVCTIGDKVTIKQCSVGSNCHIGARAKLNNSVLMDGVTIGDGLVVLNTLPLYSQSMISLQVCRPEYGCLCRSHYRTKLQCERLQHWRGSESRCRE